ncbi:MAG: polysaccharide biosynthesis C-terminal domain-containing protein [Oscillospiraceae bacterium]|nr:polysaccharide biosynthesis C-terminal domain-containing protein [Oscillospiraceae bacterium]
MDLRKISEKKIAADAVKMTLLSLAMQTAGMLFNSALAGSAGTAAVGLMSLTFSVFGFIMVLANGNILLSTSRFISEERGAGREDHSRLMRRCLGFSLTLSCLFTVISIALSDVIGENILRNEVMSKAVRLIALSLPFASAGSCIKGYFHGIRRVEVPMRGDLIEFAAKWTALFLGLLTLGGSDNFYIAVAGGILFGEVVSFVYYARVYSACSRCFCHKNKAEMPLPTDTLPGYLKCSLPILAGGYVQNLLSTANELLVPAALLKFSGNASAALAGYGCFEAMIMPAMFFPSAVLTSLSGIIVPEAALANRANHKNVRTERLRSLTKSAFEKCFSYSFFIALLFFTAGRQLGQLLCPSDPTVGNSLVILAPVIPFIYLEIILEGLLKGMGRQNFSTVTSLWEYAVRIACVIIFVGRIGFPGVLISYYASNILSNLARIYAVCKEASLTFDPFEFVITPLLKGAVCCICGLAVAKLTHADISGNFPYLAVVILTSVTAFALMFSDIFKKNKFGVQLD